MTTSQLQKRKKNQGKLNSLSGTEWLKFTKSWFALKASKRKEKKMHPATFPEELAQRFITFFSKEGDWILDPFAGSGTTLLVSKQYQRNSVGVELYEKYATLITNRLKNQNLSNLAKSIVIKGDSRNIKKIAEINKIPPLDFCITSPPYWNQLLKNDQRNKERMKQDLDCKYGDNILDLGLIDDYQTFLLNQKFIFDDIYNLMKNKAYLVIITNNVYKNGRLWPLAFDTLRTLSDTWVPKDESIWCQNDRKLRPFGMFHSYIGNRSHHYCLVFRKELG